VNNLSWIYRLGSTSHITVVFCCS